MFRVRQSVRMVIEMVLRWFIFQSHDNIYRVISCTRRNIFYEASCLGEIARIASDIGVVHHLAFKPLSL